MLKEKLRFVAAWWLLGAIPAAFAEGLHLVSSSAFSWADAATCWVFVIGVLFAARWTSPCPDTQKQVVLPWLGLAAIVIATSLGLVYWSNPTDWAAWTLLGTFYLLLLWVDSGLKGRWKPIPRWGMRGLLIFTAGVVPVSVVQIESHFSDDEFMAGAQVLAMGLFWTLILAVHSLLHRIKPPRARNGLSLSPRWPALLLALFVFTLLGVAVQSYQHSFYPSEAPVYEGISEDVPFLCGELPASGQTFTGEEVFRRLLAQLEANPNKGPQEYGMLALASGESRYILAFRESLLREARDGRFIGPANSVKWIQYEAALRAYYLSRVRAKYPDLFSDEELALLEDWFAAINRRALTVEWVDWMYGLAFSKWPEGPYENQENGAGLLALLETEALAAPDLSLANRSYLERNRRGWIARFRNTDDALLYQLEWINNAYFQSLYTDQIPETKLRESFRWLLLQALPDGVPLGYNHPSPVSLAGVAYLGAHLLHDPEYLWLAGQALNSGELNGVYPFAQPGVEGPVSLTGHAPSEGSCLLYGDSGLPNQVGPLAPDKVVFRDGWTKNSAYLLLNLRFTGWHRYKATNTVTLFYQDGPLASDVLNGKSFAWLPAGRSLFRDKRIPRENLNGLLVERRGLSAVLYFLTSIGSPWAQDPPYYAEVITFETGERKDSSHTRLTDWHGWQHDRWVYFYHNGGPVVVIDQAEGPPGRQAAVVWHLVGETVAGSQRIRLHGGDQPAQALLLPLEPEGMHLETVQEPGNGVSNLRVTGYNRSDGQLSMLTLFLSGRWMDAEVYMEPGTANSLILISQDGSRIELQLPLPNRLASESRDRS